MVHKFDFYGASEECHIKMQTNINDNSQVRGAWQKALFEQAAIEYQPWAGPDADTFQRPDFGYNS
jgi:hypothetical protein